MESVAQVRRIIVQILLKFTNEMEILKQNIFSYRIDNSHFVYQQHTANSNFPSQALVMFFARKTNELLQNTGSSDFQ